MTPDMMIGLLILCVTTTTISGMTAYQCAVKHVQAEIEKAFETHIASLHAEHESFVGALRGGEVNEI